MSLLLDRLGGLPTPDDAARSAVAHRADQVLRPTGAMARLDEIAVWLAGWQRTVTPHVERPSGLVFAGDHGVAAAGVSNYPSDVTAAMLAATRARKATINAFARAVGASVTAIDVGVGEPTNDFRELPALSPERFDRVTQAAFDAVDGVDADLLVIGELGIGNTTAAAAIAAALIGGDTSVWVGRGSGVDDEGLARKRAAVEAAVRRISGVDEPIEILRQVGGCELVAMAAAILAARHRSIPVILDGYICTASALALHEVDATALDHCVAGHRSFEPGHVRLLDTIGKRPILDLEMRLGEGSGAMAAVPIVRIACAGVVGVATFTEWFGDGPGV